MQLTPEGINRHVTHGIPQKIQLNMHHQFQMILVVDSKLHSHFVK